MSLMEEAKRELTLMAEPSFGTLMQILRFKEAFDLNESSQLKNYIYHLKSKRKKEVETS